MQSQTQPTQGSSALYCSSREGHQATHWRWLSYSVGKKSKQASNQSERKFQHCRQKDIHTEIAASTALKTSASSLNGRCQNLWHLPNLHLPLGTGDTTKKLLLRNKLLRSYSQDTSHWLFGISQRLVFIIPPQPRHFLSLGFPVCDISHYPHGDTSTHQKSRTGEFPGGRVVRTLCFHTRGPGFDP